MASGLALSRVVRVSKWLRLSLRASTLCPLRIDGASSKLSLTSQPTIFGKHSFSTYERLYNTIDELTDPIIYEKISDETLDELLESLENSFQDIDKDELDINLSNGVLTISLGKELGTYVINKQSPNKQIWFSSPFSGPKRFDFVKGKWIYVHDGSNLHELLQKELSENLSYTFDLTSLEYYELTDY